MARTSRADWLDEGLTLLGHWESRQTSAPIDVSERDRNAPARERRRRLRQLVMGLDMRLENAVRAWALRDGRARDAVTRVDQRRIAHLASLNEGEGLSHPSARALAQLEYATFVGAQQIYPDLHGTEAELLLRTLRGALRSLRTTPH
jgi:hypothetical protein